MISFVEFAKLCDIPSSHSSRRLRERIGPSLKRIAGTVTSFSRTDDKHTREYITHLVQSTYYDTERDIVQLQAAPSLFEQNDEGGYARKRANCLKNQTDTERFTRNLIYLTNLYIP